MYVLKLYPIAFKSCPHIQLTFIDVSIPSIVFLLFFLTGVMSKSIVIVIQFPKSNKRDGARCS